MMMMMMKMMTRLQMAVQEQLAQNDRLPCREA
jgi:hypothetical protein